MKLIMSLGCIRMRMLPEEVLHAVTLNGAYAMGLYESHGSIAAGKKANISDQQTCSQSGLPFICLRKRPGRHGNPQR